MKNSLVLAFSFFIDGVKDFENMKWLELKTFKKTMKA